MRKNEEVGFVTTYWDEHNNLILCNPDPDIDWDWLEFIGDDSAIVELLEFQLSNGYDMIRPEEIGALTSAPIVGHDVKRDNQGNFIDAKKIWWLADYCTVLVWEELKNGNSVTFQLAEEEE